MALSFFKANNPVETLTAFGFTNLACEWWWWWWWPEKRSFYYPNLNNYNYYWLNGEWLLCDSWCYPPIITFLVELLNKLYEIIILVF
jgi:hypothetical protein